jgi:hypothetical protein
MEAHREVADEVRKTDTENPKQGIRHSEPSCGYQNKGYGRRCPRTAVYVSPRPAKS